MTRRVEVDTAHTDADGAAELKQLARALAALPDFTGGSERRAVCIVDRTPLAARLTRTLIHDGDGAAGPTVDDLNPFLHAYKHVVDAHDRLMRATDAVHAARGAAAAVDVVTVVRTDPSTGVHPFFLYATTITSRAVRALAAPYPPRRAQLERQVASYVATPGSCLLIHRDNVVGVRRVVDGRFLPSSAVIRAALAGEASPCARCGVPADNGVVCVRCTRTLCYACESCDPTRACKECQAADTAVNRCLARHGLL